MKIALLYCTRVSCSWKQSMAGARPGLKRTWSATSPTIPLTFAGEIWTSRAGRKGKPGSIDGTKQFLSNFETFVCFDKERWFWLPLRRSTAPIGLHPMASNICTWFRILWTGASRLRSGTVQIVQRPLFCNWPPSLLQIEKLQRNPCDALLKNGDVPGNKEIFPHIWPAITLNSERVTWGLGVGNDIRESFLVALRKGPLSSTMSRQR